MPGRIEGEVGRVEEDGRYFIPALGRAFTITSLIPASVEIWSDGSPNILVRPVKYEMAVLRLVLVGPEVESHGPIQLTSGRSNTLLLEIHPKLLRVASQPHVDMGPFNALCTRLQASKLDELGDMLVAVQTMVGALMKLPVVGVNLRTPIQLNPRDNEVFARNLPKDNTLYLVGVQKVDVK